VRLSDVMTTPVKMVAATDSVSVARQMMKLNNIRHVVVARGKAIAGIVSDHDLPFDGDAPVSSFMTDQVATLPSNALVRDAANLMRGRKISCVPVVDDGKLVGIVTANDVLGVRGRPPSARPKPTYVPRALGRRART
jgi:acetoin utilization protein AcuB